VGSFSTLNGITEPRHIGCQHPDSFRRVVPSNVTVRHIVTPISANWTQVSLSKAGAGLLSPYRYPDTRAPNPRNFRSAGVQRALSGGGERTIRARTGPGWP